MSCASGSLPASHRAKLYAAFMCGMMLCSNCASLSCSSKGVLHDPGPFATETGSAGILFPNQTLAHLREFSGTNLICAAGVRRSSSGATRAGDGTRTESGGWAKLVLAVPEDGHTPVK